MGKDFYRKAVIEADPATLNSPKMVEVFDVMRKMQSYYDPGVMGRSWNLAAAMVIEGKAAILFMGDWAKGEFLGAKKEANKDYVCAPTPGTEGSYAFIADSFAFFKQKNAKGPTKGQQDLATAIMSAAYQEQAALYKGAIPSRIDASLANFDDCAKKSAADLRAAMTTDSLVPSVGQGASEAAVGAIQDVTSKFMTNPNMDSKSAAAALAQGIKASK
jgi:glucose/mannose transport system substrate-binding protein